MVVVGVLVEQTLGALATHHLFRPLKVIMVEMVKALAVLQVAAVAARLRLVETI